MKLLERTMALFGYEKRASLRNPITDWLADAIIGEASSTGMRINRNTALNLSTVWHAVSLISEDIAKTPLVTYRLSGDAKNRARNHAAYFLLKERPNEYQSKFDLWKDVMADALLGHGGYIWIRRNSLKQPVELIRLLGNRVETRATDDWLTLDREIIYRMGDTQKPVRFNSSDVIAIRGLSWDGMDGYEFSQLAADSVGYGLATQTHAGRFFRNQAMPGVVLESPKALTKEAIDNTRKQFDDVTAGLDNHYRTVILQLGTTAKTLSIDPRNAQLLESRQWSVADIANWFKLQAHKLNADIQTSYASIEQKDRDYVSQTLDGWFSQIEYQCRLKLLGESEWREGLYTIEFHRDALIRADSLTKANMTSIGLAGNAWLTQNEARGFFNLNPVPDGDNVKMPTNNFGEPEPELMPDEPAAPPEDDERMRRAVLRKELERMVARVSSDCRRAAKSGKRLFQWLDQATDRHHSVIVTNLENGLALNRAGLRADEVAKRIIEEIRERCLEISGNAQTDDQLFEWVDRSMDDYQNTAADELMAMCLEVCNV